MTAPRHIHMMALALLKQLTDAYAREAVDLEAVRAVATWIVTAPEPQSLSKQENGGS